MTEDNHHVSRRAFLRGAVLTLAGFALGHGLWSSKASAAYRQNVSILGNASMPSLSSLPEPKESHAPSYVAPPPIVETHLRFTGLENRERTDAIVVHHVGNSTDADVSAATIHQWHLANGWAGIGYHFVIRKDGTIERGRPQDTVGAHCYQHNQNTLGINLAGNFEIGDPTDAQVQSAIALLAELSLTYSLLPTASTIVGHRDLNSTLCPGRNLYSLLPQIRTAVRERMGL